LAGSYNAAHMAMAGRFGVINSNLKLVLFKAQAAN
jgi:hypothetical protein